MKPISALIAVSLLSTCLTIAQAQEVAWETELNSSFVAGAKTDLGDGRRGHVSEHSMLARAVASRPLARGPLLRLGGEWQRASFGVPGGAPIPNTLQSVAAVIGFDLEIREVLVRVEAHPGLYTTNFERPSGADFNVPIVLGGLYIVNKDLQFALGVGFDANRKYPLLPGGGVRWKFADRWLLNAILPRPRLEYSPTPDLTLFGGAEIRNSTYHVDNDFGGSRTELRGAFVEFTELRVGGGASCKLGNGLTVELESGAVTHREFNFHRAEFSAEMKQSAIYGQLTMSAKF